MAVLLLKKGFSIAKPHRKAAAKNIVSDIVSNTMLRSYNDDPKAQDGSGLMVMARKRTSKPPGIRRCGPTIKKTKRGSKKLSVISRKCKKTVKRNVAFKRSVKPYSNMALLHHMSGECIKSELDLFYQRILSSGDLY